MGPFYRNENNFNLSALYDFLDLSASETACADLDCLRCSVNECLDSDKIRSELSLLCHTNVLADTSLLLRLTLTWNNLS